MIIRTAFSFVDVARDSTLASQILQSEMENLRLKNWDSIYALEDGTFQMEPKFEETSANRFTCERDVEDPRPYLRSITLRVIWSSYSGRTMTREYSTYFSKHGLNDYYYRSLQ